MNTAEMRTGLFNEVKREDLIEVNGGCTKFAMAICYAGAGVCAACATYAEKSGNINAAAAFAGVGAIFTTVGTVLACIPAP